MRISNLESKCPVFVIEVKKAFKAKRKHHYNEYENVKLARELIKNELAELEDDENEKVENNGIIQLWLTLKQHMIHHSI